LADNRTERATPRRRQKAQEKGQVLRNRDLVSAMTILVVILLLAWRPESWIGQWHGYFARCLNASILSDWNSRIPVIAWTSFAIAQWIGPILAAALMVALLGTVAQGGFVFAAEALTPNFERLNPANNMKQLFSTAGFSRILRALLPFGVMLYLALRLLLNEAATILHSGRLRPSGSLALMAHLGFALAWQCALVLFAWSAVDFLMQRYTFERSLRMTKQEVREESKDSEGNPQIKGRLRRLRREMLRRSLQKDVRRATAVVTNPTHYAVALEYRPESMAAPVVVAKGRNLIAQRIKELARWHEIPLVENPPLAQALYKSADVGQVIPPRLYAAVAEILAFIYRAQMRMQSQPSPSTSTMGAS
jgi:flagellar biosynthesis protein FlhB